MNERIKVLMGFAGLQPYYDSQDEAIKKFAMLIVQECARVVDNLTEQDNPIEYRRTYAQGTDVLEHFGVE